MIEPGIVKIENLKSEDSSRISRIIKFEGQLDESNIDENSIKVYELIAKYPQKLFLLLDFEKLEYMNSKSIGYLADWYGRIKEGKGKIVISSAPKNIMEIMEGVGLNELIGCYSSFTDAQKALLGN